MNTLIWFKSKNLLPMRTLKYIVNEKSCPNTKCFFLHDESTMCKYDSVCEGLYCMFKHGKEKISTENESDQTFDENETIKENVFDKKRQESEKETTLENLSDTGECNNIVVVDVEIVLLNDQKRNENNRANSENYTVEENNIDDEHNEESDDKVVQVELVNANIVDVEDYAIIDGTNDDETEANDENDENIELVKKDKKVLPIPDEIAGSFVCKTCNVKANSKHELMTHKVSIHNWCTKCYSTFDSEDKLKNHVSTKHKKSKK